MTTAVVKPLRAKSGDLADVLHFQLRALRLPEPVRELRPWRDRRFKIDLAWQDRMLFVEVDGGEWTHGRHGRGAGMQSDCYKWNRLTREGWTGFRFTGSMVKTGEAVNFLEQVFRSKRGHGVRIVEV